MTGLGIGEVARCVGVQPSAVRYYERIGLLPPPRRVSGRRRYEADVLKRLGLVHLLRQVGLSIGELRLLFGRGANAPPAVPWQTVASRKIADLDAQIERLQATRSWLAEALQTDCPCVDDCVAVAVDDSGAATGYTLSCAAASRLLTLPTGEARVT
jgi:MerR family redox-sensitive transcriptional activator SoxR